MANFNTHISFGVLLGILIVILSPIFFLNVNSYILFIAFFAVIIGAFLPDIDVDTGKPFKIIFGFLAIVGSILSLLFLIKSNQNNIKYFVGIPILFYIFIRYFIGYIFKKFSHHRGIWHSIPALFVAVLITLQIANLFPLKIIEKAILSFSVGFGYLSHLILDEIFSMVNIGGLPFKVKRSFGSALKFTVKSRFVTFSIYSILLFLLVYSLPLIRKIIGSI